jgi:hypothetical protein
LLFNKVTDSDLCDIGIFASLIRRSQIPTFVKLTQTLNGDDFTIKLTRMRSIITFTRQFKAPLKHETVDIRTPLQDLQLKGFSTIIHTGLHRKPYMCERREKKHSYDSSNHHSTRNN